MEARHVLITVDGPRAVGKTTVVRELVGALRDRGLNVTCAREPSDTAYGAFVRQMMAKGTAISKALAITADRYYHHARVLRPLLERGDIVVCDRYAASLAMDVLRGMRCTQMLDWHDGLPKPDLLVVLYASAAVIGRRARSRPRRSVQGGGNPTLGERRREVEIYEQVGRALLRRGWPVLRLDAGEAKAAEVAARIASRALGIRAGL